MKEVRKTINRHYWQEISGEHAVEDIKEAFTKRFPSDAEIESRASNYEKEWWEGKDFPNGNKAELDMYANDDFAAGAKWFKEQLMKNINIE